MSATPTDNTLRQAASSLLPRGAAWTNVFLAALLMLATLPGRTQGLGLITEPLLEELRLDRIGYAEINLWATLLGSLFCLPIGWLIDRFGLRFMTLTVTLLLGAIVWQMSAMAGGYYTLFTFILLTRAFGQSALSVVSITLVGKSFQKGSGWPMGVYSLVLSILFALAFVIIGRVVREDGWRPAWFTVAVSVSIIALIAGIFVRSKREDSAAQKSTETGATLGQALRTPLFWIFAVATSLFGLASSGLGLFNEAVLSERGFDQKTYHIFMAVTTLFALVGQMVCGWLSLRHPMPRLLAGAMFAYAVGLAGLAQLRTLTELWTLAAIFGVAAGFITVIFFAIWGQAFGRAHLGGIQGAAQMLTVFASAIGPLIFAHSHSEQGSYSTILFTLAILVIGMGIWSWQCRMPASHSTS